MAKDKDNQLNSRQSKFCEEYIIDFHATKAAERSGYSKKTAYSLGSRLLKKVEISDRINSLIEKKLNLGKGALRYKVLNGISEIAFDDISIEIAMDKDGNPISLRLNDRLKALELLGKYGGLFTDKLELTGKDGGPIETTAGIDYTALTDSEAKEAFHNKINESKE